MELDKKDLIGILIACVIVTGLVTSVLVLKLLIKKIAKININIFYSASCFTVATLFSYLFQSLLEDFYCRDDHLHGFFCRYIRWESPWNYTRLLWQIPTDCFVLWIFIRFFLKSNIRIINNIVISVLSSIYSSFFGFIIAAIS